MDVTVCHPERSEGFAFFCTLNNIGGKEKQVLRFAQDDPDN
jgi:hypothetical protein